MFNKKYIFLFGLFSIMVTVLTGSLLLFRQAIASDKNYFKSSTLAVNSTCTVDGKSGSYNFSFKATELTSGVDYWQCHTTSGSWTTCPNSNGCKTYKIDADSGYDQIRTYDIAGNISSTKYLYKKYTFTRKGEVSSDTAVDYGGSNAKIIDSYYATEGTITSVTIQSDGTIKVIGTTKDCNKYRYTDAKRERIKYCKGGTYNEITGLCEAESYRLQNDTCWCAMQLVNGKLKIAWSNSPGVCARRTTYCTDEFDKNDDSSTKYDKITLKQQYGAVGVICVGAGGWGSSCDFSRPSNSERFTQYNSITQVPETAITNYNDYASKIQDADRTDSLKETIAGFATESKPTTGSTTSYISGATIAGTCQNIENANKDASIGMRTTMPGGSVIYIVPLIGSADCNWIAREPTEYNVNYGKYSQNIDGDYFYYCDGDGETITSNNECEKTIVNKCYSYTVTYYGG